MNCPSCRRPMEAISLWYWCSKCLRSYNRRDGQRSRVYKWEDVYVVPCFAEEKLNLEQCRQIVEAVYEECGFPVPAVDGGRRNQTTALGGPLKVSLPPNMRNRGIVLHECVHGLMLYTVPHEPSHGAVFMRIYLDLLEEFGGLDPEEMEELEASALRAGIKIEAREEEVA